MEALRTPDARFDGLVDFPFEPNYVEIDDTTGGTLRVHYVDQGPSDAHPVLLLHGEPSWSYLYRTMIPSLVEAGHRCVAPDLVGFGRSDKPTEPTDYTYARHVAWMSSVVFGHLDLQHITFFGQDWGGLVGLRLVSAEPDRFDRVVVGNTGFPTGAQGVLGEAFKRWREFSQTTPEFPVGRIVNGGCATDLPEEVIAAYDAPFPDDSFKAGARIFPMLVPAEPHDPARADQEAAWEVLDAFEKPFLCAYSDQDPVTGGNDKVFLARVPGTKDQPHTTITGGGHFLQEDRGPELAKVIIDFIERTS